ncbi:dipeptide ABC transporter ATP-binding protein [Enterobacteriaceae endosymbiont of Plateumaris sericea]|uniref:ABC transporter ATP-binding protein n=1 Tax=Enterobacteriaceae endosymbiont of Plateumaris sericea TaxID=2675797 RepID=UPI0014496297|nr:ABC transporter ATP-binding protein [Enterobacteriaceae endosymbiont of Plateumaris sericea]QJC29779.1 dipeptide ABC transporter ATP-binding protein [Enterobacteriaceae endosymbiont of Plateumaris sericea]
MNIISTCKKKNVLEVKNLSISLLNKNNEFIQIIHNISFNTYLNEILAIIGESGSGKSITSLSIMRLIEFYGGKIINGNIFLYTKKNKKIDLTKLKLSNLNKIRGTEISMVFQDPFSSLNPLFKIGEQITEIIQLHQHKSYSNSLNEAKKILDLVQIPNINNIINYYPYQLSGGMLQRICIAIAISCYPTILIADEPTTALDSILQKELLKLIKDIKKERNIGIIFITHNLSLINLIADQVIIMYKGRIVEKSSVFNILNNPKHHYTKYLLKNYPKFIFNKNKKFFYTIKYSLLYNQYACNKTIIKKKIPLLKIKNIITRFNIKKNFFSKISHQIYAVEKVSLHLYKGETLSIIGESGCGKSTIIKSIFNLVDSQIKLFLLNNKKINLYNSKDLLYIKKNIQCIFQNSYTSLNPQKKIGYSIMEPLLVHNILLTHDQLIQRIKYLLKCVGLKSDFINRYPKECSGGQRQRICIARALAIKPKIIIADESFSSLDIIIQNKIFNLILELQKKFNISFIIISHDITMIKRISHRIAIMYLGEIIEIGSSKSIFENPQHNYTKKLIFSIFNMNIKNNKYSSTELYSSNFKKNNIFPIGTILPKKKFIKVGIDHYVIKNFNNT